MGRSSKWFPSSLSGQPLTSSNRRRDFQVVNSQALGPSKPDLSGSGLHPRRGMGSKLWTAVQRYMAARHLRPSFWVFTSSTFLCGRAAVEYEYEDEYRYHDTTTLYHYRQANHLDTGIHISHSHSHSQPHSLWADNSVSSPSFTLIS